MHSGKTLRVLAGLTAAALLAACGGTDPQPGWRRLAEPRPDDPLAAHIFELDNGLKVYLTANRQEPRFHAEIAVRAGSKQDPADATGLAHYLEHLLFKGSRRLGALDWEAERPHLERVAALYEERFRETDPERRARLYEEIDDASRRAAAFAAPNEIDKLYNSMGATGLNAHTWHEETVYRVDLPAGRLRQWAEIESERFTDPVFRLFHTELEAVYEEKNRALDDRERIVASAVDELLHKEHPYGRRPTLGTVEHLKNPSQARIREYFDAWYAPNNMGVFISGDIDIDETIALIAEKFGHLESRPLPAVGPWPEPPLDGVERRVVRHPGREQVTLAFRTAPAASPDREALMVADMILDNRVAGLINLNLVQRQRVTDAGSSPRFLIDAGAQMLRGSPKPDQSLDEVEALLLEQLELLKAGAFEDWIIPAIVRDFRKNEKAGLEFNAARAAMMRQSFIEGADWERHSRRLERLAAVTRQDVIDAANRYFGDDYAAVRRVDGPSEAPEMEKPPISPLDIDPERRSPFADRVLAMEAEPAEPVFVERGRDYRKLALADGLTLYHAPNPLNDLFTFSIAVEAGAAAHRELSLAAALLDVAGAGGMDNPALRERWYRLGADFRFDAGENGSAFTVSGLDERFEESLRLMLSLLREPSAPPEALERLKGIVLKARRDSRESPPAIARALTLYHRYGERSPMLEALDTGEILAAEAERLLALPGTLLGYRHALAYTGPLSIEEVAAVLERVYPAAAATVPPPPPRLRRARTAAATQVKAVDRRTAQARIRIEFPDGTFDPEDGAMASLYNGYFGSGMSSVVFQELREARGLAYGASARYLQGGRPGEENLMLGAVATQADKAVEAIAALVALLDDMPLSRSRFEEAREALLNRHRAGRLGFREVLGAVRSWERMGFDGDPRPERYRRLRDAELEDLARFQREHVKDRPKLISIVGDLSAIDPAGLARFGALERVEADALFAD